MTPLCHERIVLTKYSDTYCMRPRGHEGKCSPQLDTPHPLPPKPLFTSSTTMPAKEK